MTKPLHFQSVEIQHREILQPYLTKNSRTCDRTFNNLFCWQHYYRTAWAESDSWLVVRAYINGERRAAYIVLSQDEPPHYEEIIPNVEADAAAQKTCARSRAVSSLKNATTSTNSNRCTTSNTNLSRRKTSTTACDWRKNGLPNTPMTNPLWRNVSSSNRHCNILKNWNSSEVHCMLIISLLPLPTDPQSTRRCSAPTWRRRTSAMRVPTR